MAPKKSETKVIKKTETKKTTKAPTKAVKASTKVSPVKVVTKTLAPKVVVETKSLETPGANCCSEKKDSCKRRKCCFTLIVVLLLLANLIFVIWGFCLVKEQRDFTIANLGGTESYEHFKQIYTTQEYQSIKALQPYQLESEIIAILENQEVQEN
ncbi:MAG: hypothetical protein PHU61_02635 [Candidatus Absconditabacteria bacterium]|nr:hypothetical protein [Candidatus Absconditabacteria bacterium]MDD3868132.1 hypothetical protein [Candidatus Absconditabacteria bacterium]MDD4714518.1 hypothetical protein [Candidatus Absconditabacteria bacterium]